MAEEKKSEGKISKFNEGSFQMERLHELQKRIHDANLAPLSRDPISNLLGFEVAFRTMTSLFLEVSSKLSRKEREEGIKKRKEIQLFMESNPVYSKRKDLVTGKNMLGFSSAAWIGLQEHLFQYELMIRDFLEKHNLAAPTGEDPGEAAYS